MRGGVQAQSSPRCAHLMINHSLLLHPNVATIQAYDSTIGGGGFAPQSFI